MRWAIAEKLQRDDDVQLFAWMQSRTRTWTKNWTRKWTRMMNKRCSLPTSHESRPLSTLYDTYDTLGNATSHHSHTLIYSNESSAFSLKARQLGDSALGSLGDRETSSRMYLLL